MMRFFGSRIRGTATVGTGAPPASLLAFYWHYVRQTRFWYGAMVLVVLSVALAASRL